MADLVSIPAVELVSVGTWLASTGEVTFTDDMLGGAVAAQDDPFVRSPVLKIGHDGPLSSDQPTIGRFTNLRLSADGQTVLGDLEGVPAWLAEMMPTAYPSRSIEGRLNVKTGSGATDPLVIEAVSLLGVELPAVSTLAELRALYSSDRPEYVEAGARVCARREGGAVADRVVAASADTEDLRSAFYETLTREQEWWWVRSILLEPQVLIVDSDDGRLQRVSWESTGDGGFRFGDPEEVRIEYVPVSGVAASALKSIILASYATREESRPVDKGVEMDPMVIRERLGLPAEASDEEVLAHLDSLPRAVADGEAETAGDGTAAETEAVAAGAGEEPETVVVDRSTWDEVRAGAQQGREAAMRLAREDRERKVEAAVESGRISPARRDAWLRRIEADPAEAEVLAALEPGLLPVGDEVGGVPTEDDADDRELAIVRAGLGLKKGTKVAEITCRYKPGQEVSGAALVSQVLAGRFVSVTGNKTAQGDYPIEHTAAGEHAFGVAEFDSADPDGLSGYELRAQELRVNVVRRGAIARVVAGGAVAVGDLVASDGSGRAVEAAEGDVVLGVALTGGALNDIVEVDLVLAGATVPAAA